MGRKEWKGDMEEQDGDGRGRRGRAEGGEGKKGRKEGYPVRMKILATPLPPDWQSEASYSLPVRSFVRPLQNLRTRCFEK